MKEDVPYVLTDSDDEYSDTEKILLEKARRGEASDIAESEVSSSSWPLLFNLFLLFGLLSVGYLKFFLLWLSRFRVQLLTLPMV
jgi:hypothetical protein